MKKGLLYLLMFIMGSVIFTACSDDDDPNWKKLPEEVSGENADLKINGSSTGGTIKLDVKNESEAVLNLNNVIPGCETVAVNVEMMEQEDGSFNFKGNQEVEGIEVRSTENTAKNKYDVNVSGNVTLEGKLKADLNIKLIPSSLGSRTYNGATLKLTYSDSELVGKEVLFATTDGQTANLTLAGIIPGEPQVAISNVALTVDGFKCNFTGNATTTAGTQVAYTGSVLGDTLTLSLNATLSTATLGGLAGTWNMYPNIVWKENIDDGILISPFLLKWESPYYNTDLGSSINPAHQISSLASVMVSHIIADVLHNATFGKDGNVTAQYFPTEIFSGDKEMMEIVMGLMGDDIIIPEGRVWLNSPKNLAFWYTKDDKLYLIPDIPMILKQVAEDGGNVNLGDLDIEVLLKGLQTMSGEEIKELLNNFLIEEGISLDLTPVDAALIKEVAGWLVTGIPVNYEISSNGLRISVDKEMVAPFMSILLPMLPNIDKMLEEMASQPGGELISMLPFMTGVMKLAELSEAWNQTTLFDLGLQFEN